ncbi:MAG: spore germination protein [Sellimonas intestinalis]
MGEFSVKSGWFNSEVMLYMAFVAVANYTQPNFELGYALQIRCALLLLTLTALFDWVGLRQVASLPSAPSVLTAWFPEKAI